MENVHKKIKSMENELEKLKKRVEEGKKDLEGETIEGKVSCIGKYGDFIVHTESLRNPIVLSYGWSGKKPMVGNKVKVKIKKVTNNVQGYSKEIIDFNSTKINNDAEKRELFRMLKTKTVLNEDDFSHSSAKKKKIGIKKSGITKLIQMLGIATD